MSNPPHLVPDLAVVPVAPPVMAESNLSGTERQLQMKDAVRQGGEKEVAKEISRTKDHSTETMNRHRLPSVGLAARRSCCAVHY
jgi:hypothetical protein